MQQLSEILLTVCKINSLMLKQYFAHSHFLNCCCMILHRIVFHALFIINIVVSCNCEFVFLIKFLQIVLLENPQNLAMNQAERCTRCRPCESKNPVETKSLREIFLVWFCVNVFCFEFRVCNTLF